ncbi:MAG: hypothetical protein AAF748_07235 [Pseudomonadota bacterium]
MTIRSLIWATPCCIAAWVGLLMAVSLLSDDAPAYLVLFPSAALMNALPEDAALIDATAHSVTLSSSQPGFARSLIANGAWIVLPSGLRGCAPSGEALQAAL